MLKERTYCFVLCVCDDGRRRKHVSVSVVTGSVCVGLCGNAVLLGPI